MTSQFKNPLPKKDRSTKKNDDWLTGGPQPATSGDQSQENLSPSGQMMPGRGSSLVLPPWPGGQPPQAQGPRETPKPASLADQSTVKQVSVQSSAASVGAPMSEAYVQGQHGRYGPGANGPFPSGGPQGVGAQPVFTPAQYPGAPPIGSVPPLPGPGPLNQLNPMSSAIGPSPLNQLNPASSAIGPGPLNQLNPASSAIGPSPVNQLQPGPSFSMPGRAPSMPGTFNTERPAWPGPLGNGPMGPVGPSKFGGNGNGLPPTGKKPGGKKRRKKRRFPIWARVLVGFLTLLIILAAVGLGYYQVYFSGAVSSITGQKVQLAAGEENPNANLNGDILSGPRLNILLLGSDTDEKFQGNYIAQTDIVMTIDPTSKTVGMLSIPRDFFLNVPGYGMHKLDEAYGLGGVDLSRRTIEQDFGISINYYAWVGLDGFIKVINDVGGVDVDVMHPITDDNYPDDIGSQDAFAVKRLYLAPGPQHLDGATALEYVRSRHADLVGDFGRSVRQQQVLTALKTRLTNPDVFGKLSSIANDLTGYLKTDMALADVLKLMNFARTLDINKINKLVLGPPYSTSGTAPADSGVDAGQSVVFPDCDKIVPAISQMLQLGGNAACNIAGDPGVGYNGGSHSNIAATTSLQTGSALDLANVVDGAASLSTQASALGSDPSDLFGVRSLLDLLCLGVFESPDALQL